MEENQVSFSLPKWRRQEIVSLTEVAQENAYAATTYNLNDFKEQSSSLPFVFGMEEQSQLVDYPSRRKLHPSLSLEIAVFCIFLNEASVYHGQQPGDEIGPLVLFKKELLEMNLCELSDVVGAHFAYYRPQILRKVLFQYINKSTLNTSLIQILLSNNSFLRFAVTVLVKTVFFKKGLINKFADCPPQPVFISTIAGYFSNFFGRQRGPTQDDKHPVPDSPLKYFRHNSNQLISPHYLLQIINPTIYLYRAVGKGARLVESKQKPQEKAKETLQKRQAIGIGKTGKERAPEAKTNKSTTFRSSKEDSSPQKDSVWGCLCWLKRG